MPYDFLPLRFEYSELMPAMSEAAARSHHDDVHGAYLAETNRLLVPVADLAGKSIEYVLATPDKVPADIRDAVRFSGGGHANHQFMWKIIGKHRNTAPSDALATAIDKHFGSFAKFRTAFVDAGLGLEGDGWVFLSLAAPKSEALEIVVTHGNGNVLELGKPGIMICDLWDHAYESAFAGDRRAWLEAYMDVVDWAQCDIRYDLLVQGISPP